MLTKLLNKDTHQLRSNLFTKVRQMFCNMPHFREMARKLNITVPKINQQIILQNQQLCTVYGIKEIDPTLIVNKGNQQQLIDLRENNKKRKEYYDEETASGFSIDKSAKLTIQFDLAKRIAQNLDLDICLMKQSTQIKPTNRQNNQISISSSNQTQQLTILSLSRFRQYIYRQYFLKQLKNKSKRKYIQSQLTYQNLLSKSQWSPNTKGSYKNRIKTIRIGQDVHSNDLNYKKSQIQAWIGQGQRTFKIISHNDSEKSFKALEKFCLMLEKQVDIVEEKIKNKQDVKKKPVIRYTATLEFDQQVEIDIEFINKRWRRRQAQIKLILQGKTTKPSIFNIDFTKEDYALQKAYLAAFDQAGIPYPKQYDFLKTSDKAFQKQGIMSVVKQTVNELDKKIRQQKINPYQDEPLTDEQRKLRDKQNRKIMGLRTVEDILQEMEEMKSREYEMEQYESERYKELVKELTDMLKNAKKYVETRRQES